jgi:membrane protein DedA with SNARE-associated domain
MEQIFNDLVGQYGIIAVFLLCMVEGDITLLLAGVLAHTGSFGRWSYLQVLFFGTLGAVIGDFCGYLIGRVFKKSVSNFGFYRASQPRILRLTEKFGPLSIFVSKYIYGIRAAWCVFYGVSGTPWWKFLLHDTVSCFLWVLILSGVGFLFGGAVTSLIGDFHRVGIVLLVVLVLGVIGFYLFERFWVSKKVEEVSPESIHELEKKAQNTLHDLTEGIQERLHLTSSGSNNNSHNDLTTQPNKMREAEKVESD